MMHNITAFLSSINVWLAVAIVDFSIVFIVYSFVTAVRLMMDALHPREYCEGGDWYEDSMTEGGSYYDLKEYQDDYPY